MDMIQAMVLPQFGPPELLELGDLPCSAPGRGEVLVRLIASGTNPIDAKLRADGSWAELTPPVVLGYDGAGIVEELGPEVSGFEVGDEVFYTPEIMGNPLGTYASYNVVPTRLLAKKPQALTFEQAAAVPLAGGTAWEAVVRRLALRPGETILIQGGAGGVGHFAVQFAKAAGARVIASASGRSQALLAELGVDHAIDYEQVDVVEATLDATDGEGVDAAFDIQGPDLVSRSLPAIRPFGRVACILSPQGELDLLYQRNISLEGVFLTREARRLREMTPLFDSGKVHPIIDRVLPLDGVATAHHRLESGHGQGKIVLQNNS
jgi:NADPH:quinone reductase